jgi:hypothetical protein
MPSPRQASTAAGDTLEPVATDWCIHTWRTPAAGELRTDC